MAWLRRFGVGVFFASFVGAQLLPLEPLVPLPGEIVDNALIALEVRDTTVDTTTLEIWVDSLRLSWTLEGGLLVALPETLPPGWHLLRVRYRRFGGERDSLRLRFYYVPYRLPEAFPVGRRPVTGTVHGEIWAFRDPYPYRPDRIGRLSLDLSDPLERVRLRVYHTTEETPQTPYLSRYSLQLHWGPFRAVLGDALQRGSPLDLYELYVRGGTVGLGETWGLRLFGGRTQKPVPGRTLQQEALGGAVLLKEIRLTLARFREIPSEEDTLPPRDNLVLSLQGRFRPGNFRFQGALAGALLTRDRRAGGTAETGLPQLGLIDLNSSTSVDWAGILEGEHADRRLRLYIRFRRIGTGFWTLGNPFLRNDLQSLQAGGEFYGSLPRFYLAFTAEEERDNLSGISATTNRWRRLSGQIRLHPRDNLSLQGGVLYALGPGIRTLNLSGFLGARHALGRAELSGFYTDYTTAQATVLFLSLRPRMPFSPYLTVGQSWRVPGEDRTQLTLGVEPRFGTLLRTVGALTWKSGNFWREEVRLRWRPLPGLLFGFVLRNTHGGRQQETYLQVESRYSF